MARTTEHRPGRRGRPRLRDGVQQTFSVGFDPRMEALIREYGAAKGLGFAPAIHRLIEESPDYRSPENWRKPVKAPTTGRSAASP